MKTNMMIQDHLASVTKNRELRRRAGHFADVVLPKLGFRPEAGDAVCYFADSRKQTNRAAFIDWATSILEEPDFPEQHMDQLNYICARASEVIKGFNSRFDDDDPYYDSVEF